MVVLGFVLRGGPFQEFSVSVCGVAVSLVGLWICGSRTDVSLSNEHKPPFVGFVMKYPSF